MKKTILTTFILGALLVSCGNNGKKATTENAKEVTETKTQATVTYNKLSSGSYVDWRASHLAGTNPRFGKINLQSATFSANNNELSNGKVTINLGSLTVTSFPEGDENNTDLAGHLKSADFFDTENHPTATFEITKVEKASGDYSSTVTGNLTIMGITKSITFNANVNVSEKEISIKSEDFSVDRKNWNLNYHAEGSEGVPVDYLIADDIGFTINVSVIR